MSDPTWTAAWEAWLAARFGERLPAERRAAVIADAERMRAFGDRLREAAPDNGELPFNHLQPWPGPEER